MHMADALLSPTVGGTMWAASAAALAYSGAKLRRDSDERMTPFMGVLGAFLFAAQMINFTIPGVGSSGHLAGGALLALLLGPHAAFLTIASVLVAQALFFADGGLLALGCNLFNLGIIPCFIIYPWVFKPIVGKTENGSRLNAAIVVSSILALQLGAFAVVLETHFSRIASLPFSTFLLLMQPIHLAIGIVEGAATVAVVSFVRKARPDILQSGLREGAAVTASLRMVSLFFLAAALIAGGVVSQYASEAPDGLEWAVSELTGKPELAAPDRGVHRVLAQTQEKTAVMAGYRLPETLEKAPQGSDLQPGSATGAAGVIGALLTLLLVLCAHLVLKKWGKGSTARPTGRNEILMTPPSVTRAEAREPDLICHP